jgi:membrane-associated phospholipid phosphatase
VLINATNAKFILVASAIQMLPVSRQNDADSWIGFPGERRRFVKLIAAYPRKQFVVLSGDVHYAETQCAILPSSGVVVVEATSSGISHAWGENEAVTPSHHTIDHVGVPDGLLNSRTYVATFVQYAIRMFVNYVPSRYALEARSDTNALSLLDTAGLAWSQLSTLILNPSASPVSHKLMGNSTWFGLNYGVVTIDDNDVLTVDVKDVEGIVRLHYHMKFGESLVRKCNPIDFVHDEMPPVIARALFVGIALIIIALAFRRMQKYITAVIARQAISIICGFIFLAGYFYVSDAPGSSASQLLENRSISFQTSIDDWIPFDPNAVFIYASLYLVIFLPVVFVRDAKLFAKLAVVFCLYNLIGVALFKAFPVRMVRPTILPQTSFPLWVTDLIYSIDPPTNNFPSLHCANVVFLSLLVCELDPPLTWVLILYSISVMLSTLVVKQHWIADVIGGILWGWISYHLFMARWVPKPAVSLTYSRWRLLVLPVVYAIFIAFLYLIYGFSEP